MHASCVFYSDNCSGMNACSEEDIQSSFIDLTSEPSWAAGCATFTGVLAECHSPAELQADQMLRSPLVSPSKSMRWDTSRKSSDSE